MWWLLLCVNSNDDELSACSTCTCTIVRLLMEDTDAFTWWSHFVGGWVTCKDTQLKCTAIKLLNCFELFELCLLKAWRGWCKCLKWTKTENTGNIQHHKALDWLSDWVETCQQCITATLNLHMVCSLSTRKSQITDNSITAVNLLLMLNPLLIN